MKRPVHYHASGSGGLSFACYYKELDAHLGSKVPGPNPWGELSIDYPKFPVPPPRVHTNIDEVTCRECWEEIGKRADKIRRLWRDADARAVGK